MKKITILFITLVVALILNTTSAFAVYYEPGSPEAEKQKEALANGQMVIMSDPVLQTTTDQNTTVTQPTVNNKHPLQPSDNTDQTTVNNKHPLQPSDNTNQTTVNNKHSLQPSDTDKTTVTNKHQLQSSDNTDQMIVNNQHPLQPSDNTDQTIVNNQHPLQPSDNTDQVVSKEAKTTSVNDKEGNDGSETNVLWIVIAFIAGVVLTAIGFVILRKKN